MDDLDREIEIFRAEEEEAQHLFGYQRSEQTPTLPSGTEATRAFSKRTDGWRNSTSVISNQGMLILVTPSPDLSCRTAV
jgi:hypothetical protein